MQDRTVQVLRRALGGPARARASTDDRVAPHGLGAHHAERRPTVVAPRARTTSPRRSAPRRGVIARGLGRSYGDAAQVERRRGHRQPRPRRHRRDRRRRRRRASAPASRSTSSSRAAIPQGWFVPVTPGTRQVTIGGAIAADVHGKNHHVDGSFGAPRHSSCASSPRPARSTVSPDADPELFWATIGGMGLTGVVTARDAAPAPDRDRPGPRRHRALRRPRRGDGRDGRRRRSDYRYSVAWVDCMTRGAHMGRAILTRGGPRARATDVESPTLAAPAARGSSCPSTRRAGCSTPSPSAPSTSCGSARRRSHEVAEPQSLATFFHPLDGVRDWNRLYGRARLRPVPVLRARRGGRHGASRDRAALGARGVPSFLAVLKRFGPGEPRPPVVPDRRAGRSRSTCRSARARCPGSSTTLDELVLDAGGRIYFAKDARLGPEQGAPRCTRDSTSSSPCKTRVDPEHRLTSDLARRLDLVGSVTMENAFGQPQSVVVLGGTSDIARAHHASRLCAARARTVVLAGRDPGAARRRGERGPRRRRRPRRHGALRRDGRGRRRARRRRGLREGRRPRRPRRRGRRAPGRPGARRGRRRARRARSRPSTSPGPSPRSPRCAGASSPRAAGASSSSRRSRRCACAAPSTSTAAPRPDSTDSARAWPTRCDGTGVDACRSCARPSCARKMTDGLPRTPFTTGRRRGRRRRHRGARGRRAPVIWSPPILRYVFGRAAPPARAAVAHRDGARLARRRRGRRRHRGERSSCAGSS